MLKNGFTCDLVQCCECFRSTDFIDVAKEGAALRVASQESNISLL